MDKIHMLNMDIKKMIDEAKWFFLEWFDLCVFLILCILIKHWMKKIEWIQLIVFYNKLKWKIIKWKLINFFFEFTNKNRK